MKKTITFLDHLSHIFPNLSPTKPGQELTKVLHLSCPTAEHRSEKYGSKVNQFPASLAHLMKGLREINYCFRCCAFTKHTTKNCKLMPNSSVTATGSSQCCSKPPHLVTLGSLQHFCSMEENRILMIDLL